MLELYMFCYINVEDSHRIAISRLAMVHHPVSNTFATQRAFKFFKSNIMDLCKIKAKYVTLEESWTFQHLKKGARRLKM